MMVRGSWMGHYWSLDCISGIGAGVQLLAVKYEATIY
jgi:hypothetical protein